AEERAARPKPAPPGLGIGRRAAGNLDRRPHDVVDRVRPLLVDELHAAFAHVLTDEEIVLGLGEHVDDGVADTEDIEAGCGHGNSGLEGARTIPGAFAGAIRGAGGPYHCPPARLPKPPAWYKADGGPFMSLARDVTTVGSATLLSRLLGFTREVLVAAVLGAGALSDAYF